MNAPPDWIVTTLIVLNVAALACWLVTLRRWRLVVRRPRLGNPGRALGRMRDGIASAAHRLHARAGSPTRTGPDRRTVQLDDWIAEVERDESSSADGPRESGSETWWRAWAASGGKLPDAAGSCRDDRDTRDRERATTRETGEGRRWHAV